MILIIITTLIGKGLCITDKCSHGKSPLILIIKRDDERKILNENILLEALIGKGFNNAHVSLLGNLLETLVGNNAHVSLIVNLLLEAVSGKGFNNTHEKVMTFQGLFRIRAAAFENSLLEALKVPLIGKCNNTHVKSK